MALFGLKKDREVAREPDPVGGRLRTASGRISDEERSPPAGRLATAADRQPPDFAIIGVQRGGTTSLYRYLTEHPEVGSAWRKEVHYFDIFYDRGNDWYLAHFPKRGKFQIVGEASPYYLFHPDVPQRMSEATPGIKLLAVLRDPVDRAYSHHQMNSRRGREDLSFAEAIEREPERLAAAEPAGGVWQHFSYVERGHYADQLERWFALFPREQFLILRSEDLYGDPSGVVRQAHEFLGVDPHTPEGFKPYHLSEYTEMDPATRERLRAHFAPHNRRLGELLGRDFEWA